MADKNIDVILHSLTSSTDLNEDISYVVKVVRESKIDKISSVCTIKEDSIENITVELQ